MNPNPAPPATSNARDAVNIPGILLLVSGVLGGLWSLMILVAGKSINGALIGSSPLARDPRFAEAMRNAQNQQSYFWPIFSLCLAGVVIAGAVKMRNLQSYGLAVASTVASMILIPSCCCWGIPVAIWAIVVLMKPEVKSQFS